LPIPESSSVARKSPSTLYLTNIIILRLDEDTLAECKHDTFAVTECTDTTHYTFCERSRRESCARSLHAGSAAQCHIQPSYLQEVPPVDDCVVIINEAAARVSTNGSPEILVEGTHLVTFERTATINGSEFVNLRKASKQPGIVRSPLLNILNTLYSASLCFTG